jgi:hypothetical protein
LAVVEEEAVPFPNKPLLRLLWQVRLPLQLEPQARRVAQSWSQILVEQVVLEAQVLLEHCSPPRAEMVGPVGLLFLLELEGLEELQPVV